jgi:hypothetical protein
MTTVDLQARALERNRTERNYMGIQNEKCECVSHTRRRGRDRSKGTHWAGILTGVEVEDVLDLERETIEDEAKDERGQNIGCGYGSMAANGCFERVLGRMRMTGIVLNKFKAPVSKGCRWIFF